LRSLKAKYLVVGFRAMVVGHHSSTVHIIEPNRLSRTAGI
jgi:hypothetical protein